MESSRRDLSIDMAEHGSILKNSQSTYPVLVSYPIELPKTCFVFSVLTISPVLPSLTFRCQVVPLEQRWYSRVDNSSCQSASVMGECEFGCRRRFRADNLAVTRHVFNHLVKLRFIFTRRNVLLNGTEMSILAENEGSKPQTTAAASDPIINLSSFTLCQPTSKPRLFWQLYSANSKGGISTACLRTIIV